MTARCGVSLHSVTQFFANALEVPVHKSAPSASDSRGLPTDRITIGSRSYFTHFGLSRQRFASVDFLVACLRISTAFMGEFLRESYTDKSASVRVSQIF